MALCFRHVDTELASLLKEEFSELAERNKPQATAHPFNPIAARESPLSAHPHARTLLQFRALKRVH